MPTATVRGVDLFPPPVSWVPPNCILEVDDLVCDWTWKDPFDLIHLRILIGAFTPEEWDQVYQSCYECVSPNPVQLAIFLTGAGISSRADGLNSSR